jgi:hypothetical protein
VPKSAGGSQKSFEKLYQFFISFLRGASRPKSPRSAAASGFIINDRQPAACQHDFGQIFFDSTRDQGAVRRGFGPDGCWTFETADPKLSLGTVLLFVRFCYQRFIFCQRFRLV